MLDRPARPGWGALLPGALFIGLCLAAFATLVSKAWVTEDAYITFRVVDNFVHGHGLRWNLDERVQAYTHPLWMFLHIAPYWLSGNIFLTTIVLSLVCTTAAMCVGARALPKSLPVAAGLWIVPLCGSKAFTEFATSGLESPLTFLLFALFVRTATRSDGELRWGRLSALAALAALNRLDTLLAFLPLLAWLAWNARGRLPWARIALGWSPFAAWEAFSLLYYGFPFPNTKYAKLNTGIHPLDYARQGWHYLADLFWMDLFSLFFLALGWVVALVFVLRWRRDPALGARARMLACCALGSFLYSAYVIKVGGDFMSGRFWVFPVFVSIWTLYACAPARISAPGLAALLLAFGGVKLVAHTIAQPVRALSFAKVEGGHDFPNGIVDERAFYWRTNLLFRPDGSLRWDIGGVPLEFPDPVVVRAFVGMLGFYAGPGMTLIDPHGLTDPLLARLPVPDVDDWRIGHFKRRLPRGYLQARRTGSLDEMDPGVARYYAKLREIVAGDLWSWSRLRTITAFNLGRYDGLIGSH